WIAEDNSRTRAWASVKRRTASSITIDHYPPGLAADRNPVVRRRARQEAGAAPPLWLGSGRRRVAPRPARTSPPDPRRARSSSGWPCPRKRRVRRLGRAGQIRAQVLPHRVQLHDQAGFLGEFSSGGLRRGLAGLDVPAGESPLAGFRRRVGVAKL